MTARRTSRYPSDLTDHQWMRLEEVLPEARALGRHRSVDLRAVANAISYRWETGCVWRMLPHDFPAWSTVYAYFRLWQRAGVIRRLREILLQRDTKSAEEFFASHDPAPTDAPPRTSPLDRRASPRNTVDPRETNEPSSPIPQRTNACAPAP